MKAEIISIGTELLLGEITDLNSAYLAGQLPLLGLDLLFISTVGDNRQRLVETLKHAWQRSDIIIATGGLGPTEDDVTREAIADFFEEPISIDQSLVEQFKKLFSRFNMEMPESNIKQASIIPSCQVIPNPRGTAPGWWVEKDSHVVIAMPGPPGEMQQMWTSSVAPRLQGRFSDSIILSKTIKTFSLSEAKVGEITRPYLQAMNPTVGIYAKPDGIHLRITAKADSVDKAQKLIDSTSSGIHELMNEYIWGSDSDTLEGIVADLFLKKDMNLATIEVETGGILSNIITNVANSSRFYKCGIVISLDEMNPMFGIDNDFISKYGPVSQEAARQLASSVRKQYGVSIGVGLIGVMEPENTKYDLGTVIVGIDNGNNCASFKKIFPGTRLQIKQRAAVSTLYELRKILV